MKIQDIVPNPNQPRKDFNQEELQELADNIKSVGLKEPIDVVLFKDGKYLIVDGERRYRACKDILKFEEIPVKIREDIIKTEEDAAIQSFIINDQRSGYTPQDKEAWIHNLYKKTGLSTRKLAAKLGVHHSSIDHYLEAYRFRQKLPAYLVGTLPLTSTALKQTAIIKDDKLRIRILKMLADGKIKHNAVKDVAEILGKIPADREDVFEAYSLGMLTSAQIQSLLEGAPLGRKVLTEPQLPVARFFTREIPSDVKHRILHAVSESDEKSDIEQTVKQQKEFLGNWLAQEPDKTKHDEIRRCHELQTYDTPDEIHEYYQRYSIEAIEREYSSGKEDKKDIWRAIQWWVSVLYEHREKLRHIESEELAIAVIDLVTEVLHWEAFKRSMDKWEEKYKEWEKGGVEWVEE